MQRTRIAAESVLLATFDGLSAFAFNCALTRVVRLREALVLSRRCLDCARVLQTAAASIS
jgi:hypothetical protein